MSFQDWVPRPNGRFVSFKDQPGGPPTAPYTWPQDTLTVPHGFGALPLVDHLNANLAKREFFGINAVWTQAPIGSVSTFNIPIPKDGDFWLDNICGMVVNFTGGGPPGANIVSGASGYLQIEDGNNGYPLMSNYTDDNGVLINGAPFGAFDARPILLSAPGLITWPPAGAGTRTPLLQPYCFLRGGAVRLTLTVPPRVFPFPANNPAGPFDWHLSLSGWKEYAYAAV